VGYHGWQGEEIKALEGWGDNNENPAALEGMNFSDCNNFT
jgi:hypothetical protein